MLEREKISFVFNQHAMQTHTFHALKCLLAIVETGCQPVDLDEWIFDKSRC